MIATSEVVKMTSKGQFTLPIEIRRDLSLNKDNYLYVTKVGHPHRDEEGGRVILGRDLHDSPKSGKGERYRPATP